MILLIINHRQNLLGLVMFSGKCLFLAQQPNMGQGRLIF